MKFTIAKESIFGQGGMLLSGFRQSFILIEVSIRENGKSNSGLTADFFKEFRKRKMQIFCSMENNREYCEDPHGLFPSLEANPQKLFFIWNSVCESDSNGSYS
jgi:hypothetical protein